MKDFSEVNSHQRTSMNRIERLASKLGLVLGGAFLGCAAYGQPSISIAVSAPVVEIRAESDFYEPLAPEGEWVVVGSYGKCWRPGHVDRDWRPYCNGSWERTDAGWYWVSDEPWAWATYHYGRWDYTDQYGWYWMPQTQWAPAWVSWHEGGGYVGWAPLQPSVRISGSGFVGFNESRISPRAFVFVKPGQFLDPIRPSIVVVNNTTIINQTRTITNTKIVNKVVINEGPATSVIEKASGRKVQAVAVQDLRHKQEAPVVARQPARAAARDNTQKEATPVTREGAQPNEKKAGAAAAPTEIQKPVAPPRAAAPLAPTGQVKETAKPLPTPAEPRPETQRPATPEFKPEVKPEAGRPAANTEPREQNANRPPARPTQPAQPENRQQQPAREKPAANETRPANQTDKEHQNEPKP